MKKITFKTLFIITALLLCVVLAMTLFACNSTDSDKGTEETPTETDSGLIKNGGFEKTSGTGYPASPDSWSSSTTSATDSENVVAGVISTGKKYDATKSAWDNLANPAGAITENNVLLIYNKTENVYLYTNSFSTAVGGYYVVTAKIKTVDVSGADGAHFKLTSDNANADFGAITATDGFATYTYYVEAPRAESAQIKITLSLGIANSKAKGYAIFDEVTATKITKTEYTEAQGAAAANTAFVSMLQPDGEFNYYTDTGSDVLHTPGSWTSTTGTGVTTSYLKRGIIDTANADWDAAVYGENPALPVDSTDTNVLYLRNGPQTKTTTKEGQTVTEETYTPSSNGYASKTSVQIDLGGVYKLSVWVKATVDEDESETDYSKKGAVVKLIGTDTYASDYINTTSQPLNNGWALVNFYIIGNQYRAKTFKIQLWLGTGDKDETATLTQGRAFFDKLTITKLEEVAEADRAECYSKYEQIANEDVSTTYETHSKVLNLVSIDDNLINNPNFESVTGELPDNWTFAPVKDVVVDASRDVTVKVISKADLDSAEWTDTLATKYGIKENPAYPYTLAPVLMVRNNIATAYKMEQSDYTEIKQNLHYRLSVWIKTADIAKGNNVTVAIYEQDKEDAVTSFTVNTAEYKNELTNDYVELVLFIKGQNANAVSSAENSKFIKVGINYGSGSKYDPSEFRKGTYFIANVNMEQISYTEYKNATTSDYVKTYSFASDSSTVTNGKFDVYDLDGEAIDQTTGLPKYLDEDEKEAFTLAPISGWENNVNADYGTTEIEGKKVNNLVAGIANVNAPSNYLAQFNLSTSNVYDKWSKQSALPVDFGAPNFLVIATRGEASVTVKDKCAVKSPSMSLSSNSYYLFKFYAKALNGAVGEVYLTTTSADTVAPYFTVEADGWTEYEFIVKTGLASVTAYFEIYFGKKSDPTPEGGYKGMLLLDSFSYVSIDEDKYNGEADKDDTMTAKFTTVTFDNGSTSETPAKPTGFTGNGTTSSGYVNSDTQVVGVIAKAHANYDKFGVTEEKTTTDADGKETTEEVVIEGSKLTANDIFTSTLFDTGDYLLMINNRKESYYNYYYSLTLNSETCYQFETYVRTAWLKEDANAKVSLTVTVDSNSTPYSFNVNTSTYSESVETLGEWTKLNFFVKNDKSSSLSAKLNFTLGENSDGDKVKGYMFIDNISMSAIDSDDYDTLTALYNEYELDENNEPKVYENDVFEDDGVTIKYTKGDKVLTAANEEFRLTNKVIEFVDEEEEEEEDKPTVQKSSGINTTLLWTYITSIAIAVVLIAVIIAWLVKKYAPRRKERAKAASYDKKNAEKKADKPEEKQGTARDEYKD